MLSTAMLACALMSIAPGVSAKAGAQEPVDASSQTAPIRPADTIGDELSLELSTDGPHQIKRLGDGRWMIPFEATTVGDVIRVIGEDGESSVQIPIPDGLRLVGMRAFVTTSPDVDDGHVAYFGDGINVGYVQIGRANMPAVETEVDVDLSLLESRGESARLSFQTTLKSLIGSCKGKLALANMEFRKGAFIYEGTPIAPPSVTAFLSPIASDVTLLLPPSPTASETTAAIRTGSSIADVFRARPPTIGVTSFDPKTGVPDEAWSLSSRTIAISETFDRGVALLPTASGGVVLTIGGTDQEIVDSASALIGDAVDVEEYDPDAVLSSSDASGEEASTTSPESTGPAFRAEDGTSARFTLDQLGLEQTRKSGVGVIELPLLIDQSRLGGSVRSMQIHLEVEHTPAPKDSEALLTVLVSDTLVASRDLTVVPEEDSGAAVDSVTFDIDVGPELIGRTTGTMVRVDYIPPGGECQLGSAPFTVQINPHTSYYQVEFGSSALDGFVQFPQVLTGGFDVGFDSFDIPEIEVAVRLVAALQLLATDTLKPTATDVTQAMASPNGAVLIGSIDRVGAGFFDFGASTSIEGQSGDQRVSFSTDAPFAGMSAFSDAGRPRLSLFWSALAAGESKERLEPTWLPKMLVATFEGRHRSFRDLFGDTYLIGEGIPPVSMSLGEGPIQPTPIRLSPNYLARAVPLVLAVMVIASVVVLVAWLRRRRRRKALIAGDWPDDLS